MLIHPEILLEYTCWFLNSSNYLILVNKLSMCYWCLRNFIQSDPFRNLINTGITVSAEKLELCIPRGSYSTANNPISYFRYQITNNSNN